jgi:NADH:ubiquinone oxidoreductase subunit 6 (subunit J)
VVGVGYIMAPPSDIGGPTSDNRPVDLLVTVVGWIGAALLLIAYGLTSTGRLAPQGVRFQALNLAGAAALTLNSGYHSAWPSAALNIVWIVIGAFALARGRRPPAPEIQ